MNVPANSLRMHELAARAREAIVAHGSSDVLVFMLDSLERGRVASLNAGIEEILIRHGREYKKAAPPEIIRRGKMRHCFANAFSAAAEGKGTYVEGYALQGDRLVHHAWITTDYSNAIELTWPLTTADAASYFGIPFSNTLCFDFAALTGTPGFLFDEGKLPLDEVSRRLSGL